MGDQPLMKNQIGFGGGCHWCTEAVFQALRGVSKVDQGFVKAAAPYDSFSEAVIVEFDPNVISQDVLLEIHLRTHASTSNHKMRGKYRSAVYVFNDEQRDDIRAGLDHLQSLFFKPLVTQVLDMVEFKPSTKQFQNYYAGDPEKPFCRTYIDPKLALLRKDYGAYSTASTTEGNPSLRALPYNIEPI